MKIKKRNKLLSVCLVLVLAACATIGGVLATDAIENNSNGDATQPEYSDDFQVELIRQQRGYDEKGNLTLVEYQDNTTLYPLVESAQYNGNNFDKYGMPTAEGYVDLIVTMRNNSDRPMYVRLIVAIPAALESADGNASKNALHWNVGNRFMPDGNFGENGIVQNQAYSNYVLTQSVGTAEVNGMKCNIYIFTYNEPLAARTVTPAAAFVGFYLDKKVDVANGKVYLDGKYTGYRENTVNIAIEAQAVETTGYSNAIDAFAGFGVSDNPWDTTSNPIAENNEIQ